MWNQEKYQKAIAFAGFAHRKQLVPGEEYNYVVHISNVAAETARAICSETIGDEDLAIQCALLHDVIEDTEIKAEEIRNEFGEEVLNGVLALTKNEELRKEDRMVDSLKRIKQAGKEIACVKMADRITNLQAPPGYWKKEKIKKYMEESILIYNELNVYSKFLSDRLKEKIKEYEKYLS
ncbi:MAG: HD domain-containing protein [Treponema sp.]|jgi:(p)ppGpp synthase/HD superfamily hydrolase|nr:HD domain-containing protein [Treponema sp.]